MAVVAVVTVTGDTHGGAKPLDSGQEWKQGEGGRGSAPNNLKTSHQAPPLKGTTTSQQHHMGTFGGHL
jgi:hypothetical protein